MRKLRSVWQHFLLVAILIIVEQDGFSFTDGKVIIGYVGAFHGGPIDVKPGDAMKMNIINYAFANVLDGKVIADKRMMNDSVNFAHLRELKRFNPKLKILVSLGGWGWSGGFSDAVADDSSREIFTNSALGYLKKFQLDGIDIDWEYPGQMGNNNKYRQADKENLSFMLQRLREKLDSLGNMQSPAKHYLITMAVNGSQNFLDHTEMAYDQQYLDYINLMSYDFSGPWSAKTGHHANLYNSKYDDTKLSTATSVDRYIRAGVPRNKIVIGAAFYGHGWIGVNDEHHGLYQSYQGNFQDIPLSYTNIDSALVNKQGFKRKWDNAAKANYLWNKDQRIFITYESEKAISEKAEFVRKEELAGCMFWQYFSDKNGDLLEVLYRELLKK